MRLDGISKIRRFDAKGVGDLQTLGLTLLAHRVLVEDRGQTLAFVDLDAARFSIAAASREPHTVPSERRVPARPLGRRAPIDSVVVC